MRGINRARKLLRRTLPLHRVFPRCIILIYHRVADVVSDPQLLCVGKTHFADHLEYLRRHYHPMSLQDLKQAVSAGKIPRYGVVVTFDDGYADNLWNAKPLLEAADVPATVFVTSGKVGDEREFWWDDLERLILLPPGLPVELTLKINGNRHSFQTKTSEERQNTYYTLHGLLRPLDSVARERAIAELVHWARVSPQGREDYRPMNPQEVATLADGELVEVEAHTVTHSVLGSQPVEVQRYELFASKQELEKIIGKSVTSFSYPYGGRGDIGQETIELVREAGFDIACANVQGAVGKRTNLYWLPRCLMRNWDGDEFASKLREFWR